MGSCFSKNTSTTPETPALQQSDLKSDPKQPHNTKTDTQPIKKEIFVIKHRISHDEIDRHSDQDTDKNPSATAGSRTRTSSCSKEEVDAILIQCGNLSRSNSTGAQNHNRRRRRYSRSKRSFDFDLNNRLKNANSDEDVDNDDHDALNRHRQPEVRVSSRRNSRSSSKERRISISPSRRSESPLHSNLNITVAASGNKPPAKMVSVPATDKSNNAAGLEQVIGGTVKRIHVKRNVSPAKTRTLAVFRDHEEGINNTREIDQRSYYRRKSSLQEIDNNARAANPRRTRKHSRDLEMNQETAFDHQSPSPPSYASLLLEDIHKFHQNNTTSATKEPPAFALPECVSKACLIMEAVANLNSDSNSNTTSEDKWKNLTTIDKKDSQIKEQDSSLESNSAETTIRECEVNQIKLGGFQRDFMDYPRKGIGRKSSYSIPKSTTAALT